MLVSRRGHAVGAAVVADGQGGVRNQVRTSSAAYLSHAGLAEPESAEAAAAAGMDTAVATTSAGIVGIDYL